MTPKKPAAKKKKKAPPRNAARAAVDRARSAGAIGPGRGLTAAQRMLRDQAIVAMKAQGYTFSEIGTVLGINARSASINHEKAIRQPSVVTMHPVALVDSILRDFQRSAVTYDVIAANLIEKQPAVALGAKRSADETRGKILAICADIGVFPQDLRQWRSEAEFDVLVGELLDLANRVQTGEATADDVERWKAEIAREAPQIAGESDAGADEVYLDADVVDES